MEQQPPAINITVKCTPAASAAVPNVQSAAAVKAKPKRRKNYHWTHKKKQCKVKNKTKKKGQNYLCYAIIDGNDGNKMAIFFKWFECKKAIAQFANPQYKGFNDRAEAHQWLKEQRTILNFANLLPDVSCDSAPFEQPRVVVQNGQHFNVDPDPVIEIPVAKAFPIPVPTASAVPVKNRDFSPVAEMARLIASLPDDRTPKAPICKCPTCPYMSGNIFDIRNALLLRLMQTGLITAEHED